MRMRKPFEGLEKIRHTPFKKSSYARRKGLFYGIKKGKHASFAVPLGCLYRKDNTFSLFWQMKCCKIQKRGSIISSRNLEVNHGCPKECIL